VPQADGKGPLPGQVPFVYNFAKEPILVSLLLADAGLTFKQLGEQMGTYRQAVWRRRSALEEEGVLWGLGAVVDHRRLGWGHYFIFLETEALGEAVLKRMRHFIYQLRPRANLRIIGSHILGAGRYNILLEVAAQNRLDLDRYLEALVKEGGASFAAAPRVQEVAFSMRQSGFVNPNLGRLRDLAAEP
jgi:DNA-binding Lrp family transcriptional regulator